MSDPTELSTYQLYCELLNGDAACAATPGAAALYFEPNGGESTAAKTLREQSAAQLCLECPLYHACFVYALRVQPTHGIYAGYTPEEIAVFAEVYGPAA